VTNNYVTTFNPLSHFKDFKPFNFSTLCYIKRRKVSQTAECLKIQIICNVTSWPGLLDPGDGGSALLQNVGNCISVNTQKCKSPATQIQETELLGGEYLSPFLPADVNCLKGLK
jgi:hypothetical protein